MASEACCTCASLLSGVPRFAPGSEKPLPNDKRLDCCGRIICGNCIHKNPRFAGYCPYCQTSGRSTPSSSATTTTTTATIIKAQAQQQQEPGFEDPPPYNDNEPEERAAAATTEKDEKPEPPPYAESPPAYSSYSSLPKEKIQHQPPPGHHIPDTEPEDTLHFLHHPHDTIPSLSLRYNIPASALRAANNLSSDNLLAARRTILIPGRYLSSSPSHPAKSLSLSPRPVEGEAEEARKVQIRRWMVATKVADYDVAVLYLEQAGYDSQAAADAYFADEAWERENPLMEEGGQGGKRRGKGVSSSLGGGRRPYLFSEAQKERLFARARKAAAAAAREEGRGGSRN